MFIYKELSSLLWLDLFYKTVSVFLSYLAAMCLPTYDWCASSKLSLIWVWQSSIIARNLFQAVDKTYLFILWPPRLTNPWSTKQNLIIYLLIHYFCQTPIPVQTWELTLLSRGNNNNKNQIFPEGVVLGLWNFPCGPQLPKE